MARARCKSLVVGAGHKSSLSKKDEQVKRGRNDDSDESIFIFTIILNIAGAKTPQITHEKCS